jgi:hypothetical protein
MREDVAISPVEDPRIFHVERREVRPSISSTPLPRLHLLSCDFFSRIQRREREREKGESVVPDGTT